MHTTALYVRTSTASGDTDQQLAKLHHAAEHHGWEVTDTFADAAISGAAERRPELDRLMATARTGKLDMVAVTSRDRLARFPALLDAIVGELLELGVRVVTP